jgi:hypothetical protein
MHRPTRKILTVTGAVVALFAGGSIALASSSASSNSITVCVNSKTRAVTQPAAGKACARGTFAETINKRGPAGPQGPSGVVSTKTTDLGAVASVPTGGPFVANSTEVGTVSLKAGTYLISLNAKATPLTSSAIEVFPQFFVYDQAANPSFAGDLFNVGSGPLASNSTTIDSYYSGSTTITLATDTTLHIIAFGYDSDTSAGSYKLDDLTVTATQLVTAH